MVEEERAKVAAERYRLVVRGDIVTPAGVIADGWLAVAGETIDAIGNGTAPTADQVHDARGSLVLPGVIDGQTHAGSQFGFPGLEPTTRSAVAGGVTTIVDMPYDEPDPTYRGDILAAKVDAVGRYAHCDVALYGTMLNDSDPAEIGRLVEGGVCAFKISAFESHPTRFPRITNDRALLLMQILAPTELPIGLHNEDQEIVRATLADFRRRGETNSSAHSASRPEVAENTATAAFLEMGKSSGARVHIVHMSTPRGFELVRRYQSEGTRASGEMCVHYLHFDAAEDVERLGALMKVNPPIRAGVREQLWDELTLSGSEFVSSDHSAWPLSRKQGTILDAAAGVPGLETLLPAFYSGLVKRRHDAARLTALYLAERPAKFFGLWPRKGALAVGAEADIVVLKSGDYDFDARSTHDGANWSPYHGDRFTGRPTATFVRGTKVMDGQAIVGRAGHGRFVARRSSRNG